MDLVGERVRIRPLVGSANPPVQIVVSVLDDLVRRLGRVGAIVLDGHQPIAVVPALPGDRTRQSACDECGCLSLVKNRKPGLTPGTPVVAAVPSRKASWRPGPWRCRPTGSSESTTPTTRSSWRDCVVACSEDVPTAPPNGNAALRSGLAWNPRTVRLVVPGSREVEIRFQTHDARCRSSYLANIGPVPFSRPPSLPTEMTDNAIQCRASPTPRFT
jgi:hypothetical protein